MMTTIGLACMMYCRKPASPEWVVRSMSVVRSKLRVASAMRRLTKSYPVIPAPPQISATSR